MIFLCSHHKFRSPITPHNLRPDRLSTPMRYDRRGERVEEERASRFLSNAFMIRADTSRSPPGAAIPLRRLGHAN